MSKRRKSPDLLNRMGALEKRTRKGETVYEYDPEDRPGPVQGVELDFRVAEKKIKIDYDAVVKWNPIAPGTCAADINYYIIQLQPCFANGSNRDQPAQREFLIIEDPEDVEVEELKVRFEKIKHPRTYNYKARVRVVDNAFRKGEWSAWTEPLLPAREANPLPPYPDNIVMRFEKERSKGEIRWDAVVEFSEIASWDVPPTADRAKIETTLNGGITSSATTITVANNNGLPTPQPKEHIPLTIRPGKDGEAEVISYSGKNVNQLTGVRRGLEGTTAKGHADGAEVILSAADGQEALNDIDTYIVQLRRFDKNGNPVMRNGKYVQETKTRDWDKEDDDNDGLVKVRFRNVRKREYWKARVRTKDRFRRRGEWSDWTALGNAGDNVAPPSPTNFVMDVDPRKISFVWDAPTDDDDAETNTDLKDMHPDISHFQIQVSNRSDFDKAQSTFWRNDRHHTTVHKSFKKKKTERGPFYARLRSVDGSGNKGAWVTANKAAPKPGKPTNFRRERDVNAVIFKADPPTAYDDGSTDGWTLSEVAYYKLNVYQNGVLDTERSDPHLLTLRKRVSVPKDSSGWTAKWESVGHEGESSGETTAASAESPAGLSDIGGTIGYSQYGDYSAVYRQTTPPSGNVKDGDAWIDTDDGNKMYRYFSTPKNIAGVTYPAGWNAASDGTDLVAGSVTADEIRGSYIYGYVIEGTVFYTGDPDGGGLYLKMGETNAFDRITWMSGASWRAEILSDGLGNISMNGLASVILKHNGTWKLQVDSGGTDIFNGPLALNGNNINTVGTIYFNGGGSMSGPPNLSFSGDRNSGTTGAVSAANNESGGIASGSAGGAHTHYLGNHYHVVSLSHTH